MNTVPNLIKINGLKKLKHYIEETPFTETISLNILYAINNCNKCFEGATKKKKRFPIGSENSKFMILLDNPMIYNDYPAESISAIFRKMFNAISLNLNNSYITYSTKCNIKKNSLTTNTLSNCRKLLFDEIKKLNIEYIISFGKTSANTLLDNELSIKKIREKNFYIIDNLKIIATYHPMDYLPDNNKAIKLELWEDVKLLKKILQNENILRNSHSNTG